MLGPAQRALRPLGQAHRGLQRALLQHLIGHGHGDEANALGLQPIERLAGHQVVFRLRHAAEQRPDDGRMVARRHTQLGVAIDQLGGMAGNGDIGHQRQHQPRPHRRAIDGGDDGLGAADHVVNHLPRLLPDADAGLEILHHPVDQIEVAAGGKTPPGAGDDDATHAVIGIDLAPHLGQRPVHVGGQRVQRLGPVEGEAQDARMRPVGQHMRQAIVIHCWFSCWSRARMAWASLWR